jgi:hypothetical protein
MKTLLFLSYSLYGFHEFIAQGSVESQQGKYFNENIMVRARKCALLMYIFIIIFSACPYFRNSFKKLGKSLRKRSI